MNRLLAGGVLMSLMVVAGPIDFGKANAGEPKENEITPDDEAKTRLDKCKSAESCTLLCPSGAELTKKKTESLGYVMSIDVFCEKDGEKHGPAVHFSSSPTYLMGDAYYREGKEHGIGRLWYQNGEKEMETHYKNGKQVSNKCWDKQGKKTRCPF